jgi:hypothetical protein
VPDSNLQAIPANEQIPPPRGASDAWREIMAANVVTLSVGLLGLGLLILLTVVVLNRRATLNRINASLAQISNQLRAMQNARGGP